MKKLLLIGNYGFGDLGDEAMLKANLEVLKEKYSNFRITVASNDPSETKEWHHINSVHMLSSKFLSEFIKSDVVVIGSGSFFNWRVAYYINKMSIFSSVTGLLSIFLRKKLDILAIGAEEKDLNFLTRFSLKIICNRACSVTVRNASSLRALKNIGVSSNISVVGDPALCVQPAHQNIVRGFMESHHLPNRIFVVNLRSLNNNELYKTIISSLAEVIEQTYDNYGVKWVFLPFAINKFKRIENDVICGKSLLKCLKRPEILHVVDDYLQPELLMGLVKEADLLIGTRLHPIVFSYATGTPFISINFNEKNRSFLESVGLSEFGLEPSEVTTKRLIRLINTLAYTKEFSKVEKV